MNKYLLCTLCCCFGLSGLWSQPTSVPLQSPDYLSLERLEILTGLQPPYHTAIRPYSSEAVARYAEQLDTAAYRLHKKDVADIDDLLLNHAEWLRDSSRIERRNRPGYKGVFFPTPANFIELKKGGLYVRVNPMLHIEGGRQQGDTLLLFANRRGLEVQGSIDDRVWFYTSLVEQQARFADYVDQRIQSEGAIPGAGFYKSYSSRVGVNLIGYDYNLSTAYIGFKASRNIAFRFGHAKHFIGNGYRSLLLSDYGNNMLFLEANSQFGKFHYQNIWMELTPFAANANVGMTPTDALLRKKYASIHYLSYRPTPSFSVGLMEGTMFQGSSQFKVAYLNPVMLSNTFLPRRTTVLGLNAHWDLWHRVRLYGQAVLTDFDLKPNQRGWWGNKYGFQAGLKYCNVLSVKHLDLQVEYNVVRPYTYSTQDSLSNWMHYRQPLAHPLGGNFKEWIGILRYQPTQRLSFTFRAIQMVGGDDPAGQNWGTSVLRSDASRIQSDNNTIAQGVRYSNLLLGFHASLQVTHLCYLDIRLLSRQKTSELDQFDQQTTTFNAGIRYNFGLQSLDF